ncbi:MAG: aromatic ring-hydroxylating oxygenase subunit alpha, partial [Candidatus Binataceae bacterium]
MDESTYFNGLGGAQAVGIEAGGALARMVEKGRVHSKLYTSPAIFELELERIFHRAWLYIGHASEVPEAGDFRLRRMGRQPVILVRGDDGAVRVLMNRCRHRGAMLCETDSGREAFFRCWFHGWTYANTGKLVSITSPEAYGADFRKEDRPLAPPPRIASYRDFIFASLAPDGPPLRNHLGLASSMIDLLIDAAPESAIVVNSGCHKTIYKGNWKLVGMDGYHPQYVHASVFSMFERKANSGIGATHRANPFDEKAITYTRDLGNGHSMLDFRDLRLKYYPEYTSFLETIAGGKEYIETMAARRGAERAKLLIAIAGDPHVGIFPNMQVINNQIRIINPLSVGETEVLMFPVLLKGVSPQINALRLRQHESFYGPAASGSPDDAEIFERAQRGMMAEVEPWIELSRGLERERVDSDGSIVGHITDEVPQRAQFRRWVKEMTG